MLRLAQTVADLEEANSISVAQIAEALSYRAMAWAGEEAGGRSGLADRDAGLAGEES